MALRDTIELIAASSGCSLNDLTVMAPQADPYRIDTPASHRDAEWLARQWNASGARRPLHLRGLHYMLVSVAGVIKPNGDPYLNTDKEWEWLQVTANKARWLNHIRFHDIVDERNAAPCDYVVNYTQEPTFDIHASTYRIGAFDLLLPFANVVNDIAVTQAYRLVLIGEKVSLSNVLGAIARRFRAELVLPSGELSTTLLYGIVSRAYHDGRPCRVFYFADFDPSGHHMPVEVARKAQALVEGFFPDIDIQIHRCALTVEQVREFDLPSTPLKQSDPRADKWRERWGVDQTEIDALATLRPDVLRGIAEEALDPYYDDTLSDRANEVQREALSAVEEAIERGTEAHRDEIESARRAHKKIESAGQRLALQVIAPLAEKIIEAAQGSIPMVQMPESEAEGDTREPLFNSKENWVTQTKRLTADRL